MNPCLRHPELPSDGRTARRQSCRTVWRLGLAAWLGIAGPPASLMAAVDPGLPGPHPAAVLTVSIPGTGGVALSTDVYFPGATAQAVEVGAGACPAVVFGHGFSGAKSQHANTGRHLATHGFIVAIPNFNGGSDHARNGQDLSRCVDWLLARGADAGSIFHQRVAVSRVGAAGYSAGGLSAILAASNDVRIRVLSLLDPVDNGGQGVAALTAMAGVPGRMVPAAFTHSEPSSCNAGGSATTLLAAAGGAKRGMRIVGGNHTDPQDPANPLAALVCGAANSGRQALYRRYVTGWFLWFLRDDLESLPSVFAYPGGILAADVAAGRVTYAAPLAPLRLGVDAGVAPGTAEIRLTGPPGQGWVLETLEAGAFGSGGPGAGGNWMPSVTGRLSTATSALIVPAAGGDGVAGTNGLGRQWRTRSVP